MGKEQIGIPRGTRDFGPAEMKVRNAIFATIRSQFELFGFSPLETPAMENLSVLTGKYGEEGDQLIYKILNSGDFLNKVSATDFEAGSKKLLPKISEKALRYDLTVPLARYVVMNRHQLTFPFRRYQMQPVWRADRPSFGRYREFYQCDADVVGTRSLLCEVEIIQLICAVLSRLGVEQYLIKINHRKILAGLAAFCGAPGKEADMSVSIDKLDKIEWPEVAKDLANRGFPDDFVTKLQGLLKGATLPDSDDFKTLHKQLSANEEAQKGFEELIQIFNWFPSQSPVWRHLRFDLTLARGLSYYTGPIFEVVPQGVKVGSISGGGRYDELTAVFGLEGIPGVGFSFGIDRIYDLLYELGKTDQHAISSSRVLITQFDENAIPYYLELRQHFIQNNISCELYPEAAKLKKQFAYADAKQIPFVVVAGEDERRENVLTLKNLAMGTQQKLSLAEAISACQI